MAPDKWDKGHKPLSVTSSIEDRLEPKGKGWTCKLRVEVWMISHRTSSSWIGKWCGGQKMAPHVNKWSPLDGADNKIWWKWLDQLHIFIMQRNNDNHRKKSAFPPYVTLYDETKCRSSAAVTSRQHKKLQDDWYKIAGLPIWLVWSQI